MDTIYRVRPANNHTLDELNNSYLWFSRPIGFKGDINDANIAAFINDTEAIKRGIDHSLPNFPYERFCKQMEHTGICCFTTECPDVKTIRKFPKCSNGNSICIEYDRHKLEEFFLNHRTAPIYPCFIPVIYDDNPTKLQTNGEWSILWNKDENGEIYKTIPGILHEHPRELDRFIRMLLTRINSQFKGQKEERIILGGRNIPNHDNDLLGYRIPIPEDTIKNVIVYPAVHKSYVEKLEAITFIKDKIIEMA